jgi:hypothetical protein
MRMPSLYLALRRAERLRSAPHRTAAAIMAVGALTAGLMPTVAAVTAASPTVVLSSTATPDQWTHTKSVGVTAATAPATPDRWMYP